MQVPVLGSHKLPARGSSSVTLSNRPSASRFSRKERQGQSESAGRNVTPTFGSMVVNG